MSPKVWLGFVMLGFAGLSLIRLGHPKPTARCLFALFLEEGLILLKAFRAECNALPRKTQNRGPKGRAKSAAGLG